MDQVFPYEDWTLELARQGLCRSPRGPHRAHHANAWLRADGGSDSDQKSPVYHHCPLDMRILGSNSHLWTDRYHWNFQEWFIIWYIVNCLISSAIICPSCCSWDLFSTKILQEKDGKTILVRMAIIEGRTSRKLVPWKQLIGSAGHHDIPSSPMISRWSCSYAKTLGPGHRGHVRVPEIMMVRMW